ncbi:hypothetical protein [Streptomyces hokutonensis]|uniref:Spore-associated protein A n=1 Tax=Streptomyces hokutonensis TaxID=1306990 RepID=A0ABW6M557_9ACTN
MSIPLGFLWGIPWARKSEEGKCEVRRILVGLVASAAVAAGGLVAAPSASAAPAGAYGCAGSEIDTYNIKDTDGSVWGTIHLYYSSADGGTNCAVNVARKYSGQRHMIEVVISDGSRTDADKNHYYYEYAGPVSLNKMSGKCVTVSGWVTSPSGSKSVGDQWANVHC